MTEQLPKITRLNPMVYQDNRRVMMEMVVENLPDLFANVAFTLPGAPTGSKTPTDQPSPYPNIELTILDSRRRPVASLFIVEHKEPQTSLTMHLRTPDPTEQYTARAEMTYQDKTLQVVEIPFQLKQAEANE